MAKYVRKVRKDFRFCVFCKQRFPVQDFYAHYKECKAKNEADRDKKNAEIEAKKPDNKKVTDEKTTFVNKEKAEKKEEKKASFLKKD